MAAQADSWARDTCFQHSLSLGGCPQPSAPCLYWCERQEHCAKPKPWAFQWAPKCRHKAQALRGTGWPSEMGLWDLMKPSRRGKERKKWRKREARQKTEHVMQTMFFCWYPGWSSGEGGGSDLCHHHGVQLEPGSPDSKSCARKMCPAGLNKSPLHNARTWLFHVAPTLQIQHKGHRKSDDSNSKAVLSFCLQQSLWASNYLYFQSLMLELLHPRGKPTLNGNCSRWVHVQLQSC